MNEDIAELLAQKRVMVAALDAVLLFHSGSPWDWTKKNQWINRITVTLGHATGQAEEQEATTKNLCNAVRAALTRAGTVFKEETE